MEEELKNGRLEAKLKPPESNGPVVVFLSGAVAPVAALFQRDPAALIERSLKARGSGLSQYHS
eukprot:4914639-Amphidinium_carterae.1